MTTDRPAADTRALGALERMRAIRGRIAADDAALRLARGPTAREDLIDLAAALQFEADGLRAALFARHPIHPHDDPQARAQRMGRCLTLLSTADLELVAAVASGPRFDALFVAISDELRARDPAASARVYRAATGREPAEIARAEGWSHGQEAPS